jgi:hypothetical protein
MHDFDISHGATANNVGGVQIRDAKLPLVQDVTTGVRDRSDQRAVILGQDYGRRRTSAFAPFHKRCARSYLSALLKFGTILESCGLPSLDFGGLALPC